MLARALRVPAAHGRLPNGHSSFILNRAAAACQHQLLAPTTLAFASHIGFATNVDPLRPSPLRPHALVSRHSEGAYNSTDPCVIQIKACGADFRKAAYVLNDLEAKGEATVDVFNACLQLYAKLGQTFKALELLDRMLLPAGPPPNVVTYAMAISACTKAGQFAKALQLLRSMEARGVPPNRFCYNAAISALGRSGNWQQALGLLREMDKREVSPDEASFNAVIAACDTGGGQWERAVELMREMAARGVKPDLSSYTSCVSSCAKVGRVSEALALLAEMRSPAVGIAPDVMCYSSAVAACGTAGHWEAAVGLLKDMREAGVPPNAHAYTGAINACGVGGHWSKALALLLEMQSDGVIPTAFTFSAAILALGSGGQWKQAVAVLRQACDVLKEPSRPCFSAAVVACSKSGKWREAAGLLREMEGSGIRASFLDFTSCIRACETAAAGEATSAGETAAAAGEARSVPVKTRGLTVSSLRATLAARGADATGPKAEAVASLKLLEVACTEEAKAEAEVQAEAEADSPWACALALHRAMAPRGLRPSEASYSALLGCLDASGRVEDAARVLEEAVASGCFGNASVRETVREGGKGGVSVGTDTSSGAGTVAVDLTVDLHRCSVGVGRVILRGLMADLASGKRRPGSVKVITGRGAHASHTKLNPFTNSNGCSGPSPSGQGYAKSVLGDAMRSFIRTAKGPACSEVGRNPGVFVLEEASVRWWLSQLHTSQAPVSSNQRQPAASQAAPDVLRELGIALRKP